MEEKLFLFSTFKFIKEKISLLKPYSSSKYCLPDISDAFINLMAAKELIIKKKKLTHIPFYIQTSMLNGYFTPFGSDVMESAEYGQYRMTGTTIKIG